MRGTESQQEAGPRVLLSFDSFKDTLESDQVAAVVREVVELHTPAATVEVRSLSDGGEGFLSVFQAHRQMEIKSLEVTGPLGVHTVDGKEERQRVTARYGIYEVAGSSGGTSRVGVTEMAQAAGLELVPDVGQRNPLHTTTRGVGELLRHMRDEEQCTRIILGVGGSATSDGGLGMLPPLGVQLELEDGRITSEESVLYGRDLLLVSRLLSPFPAAMQGVELAIACDVTNPFTGPHGAVHVFAQQKGADAAARLLLESGMQRWEAVLVKETNLGEGLRGMAGSGAAGGISGCLVATCASAGLLRGILVIDEAVGLGAAVRRADVVFSGEGSYDRQTQDGKVVSHVEQLCTRHGKPLVVICGRKEEGGRQQSSDFAAYDLLSACGEKRAMGETAACVREVLETVYTELPVLGQ